MKSTTKEPAARTLRGKTRKEQMADLQAEIAELRNQLSLGEHTTLDLWELMPQDMRDDLAARAIFQENASPFRALVRLGFDPPSAKENTPDKFERIEILQKMIARVFDTPGVKARLEKNFSDAEAHRSDIIAVQVEIALRGSPDQAIRATQNIARLQGWLAHEVPPPGNTTVHLWGMVAAARTDGEPKRVVGKDRPALTDSIDVLDVLSHEPGAAVRIDSENPDVDAALEQVEEDDEESARDESVVPDEPTEVERGIE